MSQRAQVYFRLKEALQTGEIVGLCYHGGSQPGAYRELVPLSLSPDRVIAWCRHSQASKFFLLDAIEILQKPPSADSGIAIWIQPSGIKPDPPTISEIEKIHRAALEEIGWLVNREGDADDEALCLYKRKRNGSSLKYPTITLRYETTAWDSIVQRDGSIIRGNLRPRVRPWSVRGRSGGLGAWGDPGKALSAFLREAATFP